MNENITKTEAWKTLLRFTAPEDRRPIKAVMHGEDKLRRVVSVSPEGLEWKKFNFSRNPYFIYVAVVEGYTRGNGEYLAEIASGETVKDIAVPDVNYPKAQNWQPLPLSAIRRVLFAASKPPALMPLYDGVFIDYRNGRVMATDREQVCSVPIEVQNLDTAWIPYAVAKALPKGEYIYCSFDGTAWVTGMGLSVIYGYTPTPTPPVRVLDNPPQGALIICSKKWLLNALKRMDNGDKAEGWIDFETGLCWNPAIRVDQDTYDLNGKHIGVEYLPELHKIGVASNPHQIAGNAKAFVSVRKLLAAVRACREGDEVTLESGVESTLALHSGDVVTHIGQLRR